VKQGTNYIFSKGDINVTLQDAPFNIITDPEGIVDVRVGDRLADVTFTPAGQITSGIKTLFWPLAGQTPEQIVGVSVFGGSDTPVELCDTFGRTVQFSSGKVVRMPTMILSAVRTPIADVSFQCIADNSTDWTGVGSFYTAATGGGTFNASAFSPSDVKTEGFTVAWAGGSPWTSTLDSEGVTVSFDLETVPIIEDIHGTVDFVYGNLIARASLTMLNGSEQDLLGKFGPLIDGAAAGRGKTLIGMKADLTLTSSWGTIVLKNAILDSPPSWKYQRVSPRLVNLRFRTIATPGTAIFTIA
jgi:hypothetical protein